MTSGCVEKGRATKDSTVEFILDCGSRYRSEMLLPHWDCTALLSDWRPAFDLFLGRCSLRR